ncbi:MAG: bifunctional transaldolase/phosoglucose isomerase, partial [Chloroflexi bacterium]|nr:bifunctional transaldolase/phosoglucose isomerase [Chloroflexota bacterium]
MTTILQQVQRLGQSIWYDNIRRGLIASGELQHLIELGVTGITANPTIFEKAIAGSTDYDSALKTLASSRKSLYEVYEALAVEDIREASDLLRPVYESTGGADGYVSLEVNPSLAHDTEATVAEARRLFTTLDRPNVMVKVPATPEGIPAIRRLIAEGINVNVTLIFSLVVYRQVIEAYISGLEDLARTGGELGRVASVASFFVSRVDTAVDAALEERVRHGDDGLRPLLGKAAIANARLAYREFKRSFAGERFATLRARGARVQRPLWASTGTKNPGYSDVMYLESLIGPDTVNTVPPATLTAFLDHGRAESMLEQGIDEASEVMEALSQSGISMAEVTARLLAEGVRAFADSFQKLLGNVDEKVKRLNQEQHVHPGASLGSYLPVVEQTLTDLEQRAVVARIWQRDHTVWKPTPEEIADRLGWLNVSEVMCEQVPALEAFAREVREARVHHVVLLGMGGSSLGPEVLRQTFGSAQGYPELLVLDSTVPAWVQAVTEAIDLARTLFLVSSKSGTTLETLSLYRYFRALVEERVGKAMAGRHFVAITDPGTPLERLAQEQDFRRTFLHPAAIGGRFRVLSYFGRVPAALVGLDLAALLD